jgi:glycosyltransferase involved in cell wall biosynthesis
VIPNGVDVEHMQGLATPEALASLYSRWPDVHGDGPRGISVGRLEANKGFDVLLRALADKADRMPPGWAWFVVGEGSQRETLEALSARLGLDRYVHFTGALSEPELHSLFKASDLLAHPTLYEGSSLVTLEAMAHGLPVVASAVGGIPDKVEQGANGFLVRPGDHADLGGRIVWLAQHTGERASMGRRSADLARERFSLRRSAAMTKHLFEMLISQKQACRKEAQTPGA